MANIVAGVILTYTRAFRLGDRVKIADTLGDVVESTLLATRVRSIKNEIITVPNSMVLGAHITNFTSRSGGREALYAELHQNIQDCFNEAGVEIMSPHYTSMRDGNRKAIPGDYLPKSYEPPFFRVGPDRDRKAAGAE